MLFVRMSYVTIPEVVFYLGFSIFGVIVRRFFGIGYGGGLFIFVFCTVRLSILLLFSFIIRVRFIDLSIKIIYFLISLSFSHIILLFPKLTYTAFQSRGWLFPYSQTLKF